MLSWKVWKCPKKSCSIMVGWPQLAAKPPLSRLFTPPQHYGGKNWKGKSEKIHGLIKTVYQVKKIEENKWYWGNHSPTPTTDQRSASLWAMASLEKVHSGKLSSSCFAECMVIWHGVSHDQLGSVVPAMSSPSHLPTPSPLPWRAVRNKHLDTVWALCSNS